MQFFGIGLFELMMVLLVALVVVGPDKLPQTAREIGKVVRNLRRYAYSVQREVREGFSELTEELENTERELKEVGRDLSLSQREIEDELTATSRAVEGEFVDAEASPTKGKRSRNGTARSATPRRTVRESDSA
jgi:sec-independent protein translocase protein TatB